jgi:hypothetical protein
VRHTLHPAFSLPSFTRAIILQQQIFKWLCDLPRIMVAGCSKQKYQAVGYSKPFPILINLVLPMKAKSPCYTTIRLF